MCSRSWQGSVQLGDLAVDERTQSLFQFIVVPLQLSVVLLLVRSDQGFILAQRVLAPARQIAESLGLFFLVTHWSVPEVRSVSSPLSEVFKAKAQFVVMAKELWIIWNFRKKDLRHFKGTLFKGRNCYTLAEECRKTWLELKPDFNGNLRRFAFDILNK